MDQWRKRAPQARASSTLAKPSAGNSGRYLAVRDTSIGLDAGEAEFLFVPYRQVASAGRTDGLGLGLLLVKRLAEMHGG